MDDTSAFTHLHLDQEEERMAILMNPISNYNPSYWSTNPTQLTSASTFSIMDNIATPPFITAPNFPPCINELHNFSAFSHFKAPTLNSDSHLSPNYNTDITTPEMVYARTSNSVKYYEVVEKTTELLCKDRQSNRIFLQKGSYQPARNIGLAADSSCFSPWVAPEQGGIMVMDATPTKGQLLLKKCLLKMLPWTRDVNNPMEHGSCGDINLGSHVVCRNPNNNEAMAYDNDAMLTYGNCSNTTTITIGKQDGTTHHHLLAERTRRRKHNEYLKVLQALLPENPKKDKVGILNSVIKHIKELKDCNQDLKKRMKELESTTLVLKSRWVSDSSSSMQYVRGKGIGYLSTNTNNPVRVRSSPNTIITSSHHSDSEHADLHHPGTTSSSTTSVTISTTLQSDHTLSMHILAPDRLTLGSNQLIKVLTCLKVLDLEVLSLQSRFEGMMFMAEISTRANKGSSFCETRIQDSLVNALSTMDSSN